MAALTKLSDGPVTFNGFVQANGIVTNGGNTIQAVIDEQPRTLEYVAGPPMHYISSPPPEPTIIIVVDEDGDGVASKDQSGGYITWSQS